MMSQHIYLSLSLSFSKQQQQQQQQLFWNYDVPITNCTFIVVFFAAHSNASLTLHSGNVSVIYFSIRNGGETTTPSTI
jgi:hypothetical protein